jgi:hypothetical protein
LIDRCPNTLHPMSQFSLAVTAVSTSPVSETCAIPRHPVGSHVY